MADAPGPGANGLCRALIFLGPPGAGKGTQARVVAKLYAVPHISSGDMFREHVERGSPLGQRAKPFMECGELVPDEIVLGMVEERIARPDCSRGFVLDGFPRTMPQAQELDEVLRTLPWRKQMVMHFVVDTTQLLRRLTGRRTCAVGGEIYNIYNHPPKSPGRCDNDGGELIQRPDDREEVIRGRLGTYEARTRLLVEYYQRQGVLVDLDGMAPPAEVTVRIAAILAQAQ